MRRALRLSWGRGGPGKRGRCVPRVSLRPGGGPSAAAAERGADPSGRDVTATGPRPPPALSPAAAGREGRSGRAAPAGLQSARPPGARGRKVPLPWWRTAPASGDPFLSSLTPRNVTTKLLWFREPSSVKSCWVWARYLCHGSTRQARPSSAPAWLYSAGRSLYPARAIPIHARAQQEGIKLPKESRQGNPKLPACKQKD